MVVHANAYGHNMANSCPILFVQTFCQRSSYNKLSRLEHAVLVIVRKDEGGLGLQTK